MHTYNLGTWKMALSTPLASPSSSSRLKALPLRPLSNEAAVTGASADLWLRDTVLKVYLSELDYFFVLRNGVLLA